METKDYNEYSELIEKKEVIFPHILTICTCIPISGKNTKKNSKEGLRRQGGFIPGIISDSYALLSLSQ